MALCEECGSIQIARAHAEGLDRLLGFFTSRRPFICRRCGWRARRDWTDAELKELQDYDTRSAMPDPELAVLDGGQKRRKRPRPASKAARTARKREFDLSDLDLDGTPTSAEDSSSAAGSLDAAVTEARQRVDRRKRRVRREIVATVALTTLAMFVFALMGFTGSCVGAAGTF